MKAKRLLGAALALGLGLGAVTSTTIVEAQGKKSSKAPAAPAIAATPPTTKLSIALIPRAQDKKAKTLSWGMTPAQVASVIDKVIDESHAEDFRKTPGGPNLTKLEQQVQQEKIEFKQSRVDFGATPTGIDSTPLKGEYTYNNKEAMLTYERGKAKTHFFFIQDRLWKIIDERTLGEGSKAGKDYAEAVSKLANTFGIAGRVLPADFDNGRYSTEVDWKDASTHLRAVQRHDTALAIILEDNVTLGNLDALRPNKPADDNGIDPAVAAAVRKDGAPPDPKQDEKKK
ncbi:hypothetical protein [Chondromyces crocatus]|uniref:Secreted protein n=1 Tax=Chondromyces crocatus TaxID=52 RepID=A0A0K1EAV7_CHOCO|nr:hypothetical protein [Chondromyces crocatus]AKT38016.1 uncharacterized protein CMC5_021570 [Chondromyces crocatus]